MATMQTIMTMMTNKPTNAAMREKEGTEAEFWIVPLQRTTTNPGTNQMTLRALAQRVTHAFRSGGGRTAECILAVEKLDIWLRENPEGELPAEGAYLIAYEDRDKQCETFSNAGARDASLKRFEEISDSWNAHLYVKIRSNSQDCTVADYSPSCTEPVPQPEAVRCLQGAGALWVFTEKENVVFDLLRKEVVPCYVSEKNCVANESFRAVSPTAARQLLAEADWPEGLAKFDEAVGAVGASGPRSQGAPEPVVKEDLTTEDDEEAVMMAVVKESFNSAKHVTVAVLNSTLDAISQRLKVPNGTPMNARIDELLAAEQERDRLIKDRDSLRAKILAFGEGQDFDWDVLGKIDELETENDKLKSKLDYLKSCGLTVGMLKDQHGERWAYDIASGSELSDDLTLSKLLDAEIERDRLRAEVEAKAETMRKAYIEQARLVAENERLKGEVEQLTKLGLAACDIGLEETAVHNPKEACSYFPPNSLSMNNTPNR